VQLLQKYKTRDKYFSTILEDLHKVEFLRELSNAYITHRYGEAGAESNMKEIIVLADELAFNLRNIYIRNIKLPSNKIYIPNKVKEDFLLDNRTLPVIRYNSRNSKKTVPFMFRAEELVQERTNGTVHLDVKQLQQDYRKRIEVEHSISTMKSLGLEQPYSLGYNAVKTHTFLILIYRLAIGIYRYIEQPNANLREVKIEL